MACQEAEAISLKKALSWTKEWGVTSGQKNGELLDAFLNLMPSYWSMQFMVRRVNRCLTL